MLPRLYLGCNWTAAAGVAFLRNCGQKVEPCHINGAGVARGASGKLKVHWRARVKTQPRVISKLQSFCVCVGSAMMGSRHRLGAVAPDPLPEIPTERKPWNLRCPGNMDKSGFMCACGLFSSNSSSSSSSSSSVGVRTSPQRGGYSGPGCRVGDAATRDTLWFSPGCFSETVCIYYHRRSPVTRGIAVQRDLMQTSPPVTRKPGKPHCFFFLWLSSYICSVSNVIIMVNTHEMTH